MAQVLLPRMLATLVAGLPKETTVEAANVQEVIAALDQRWPGVITCLCGTPESIRPHINIYVDGARATLATPVGAESVVRVLAAVSGG
jgi:molybdopterin synthase sulfur carrier subunit